MYNQVASKLYVASADDSFSQAVSMEGANAVAFEFTTFHVDTGTLTVSLEESNDLENWSSVSGASATATQPAYGFKSTGAVIAMQYVRLKYSITEGSAIVAAGINTANL